MIIFVFGNVIRKGIYSVGKTRDGKYTEKRTVVIMSHGDEYPIAVEFLGNDTKLVSNIPLHADVLLRVDLLSSKTRNGYKTRCIFLSIENKL